MNIDTVSIGFSKNKINQLNVCDKSIIKFWGKCLCLYLPNKSHVDTLYRFRKETINKIL